MKILLVDNQLPVAAKPQIHADARMPQMFFNPRNPKICDNQRFRHPEHPNIR